MIPYEEAGMGRAPTEGGRAKKASRPLVFAHRGGAGLAPENTMAACRRALDLGVDGVELDVRLSREGHPVVIHDATVDRTMEGTGRVGAVPLAALQALRARGGDAAGVPTLHEALALVRRGARVFLDVKTNDGEPHRAIEEKVLVAVRAAGTGTAVTFISFDLLCLRRLRELEATAPLGLLASWAFFQAHGRAALGRLLDEARCLGAEGVGVHHELMTPELLRTVQEAGLAAGVWTVNEASAMRRFALLGVDAITTDRPDLLQQVLAELPAGTPGD